MAKTGPTYQFIHETVREFFLSGDGFQLLHYGSPSLDRASILGNGFSMVAECLVNYLDLEDFTRKNMQYWGSRHFADENPGLSLLYHVCGYLFEYMEKAEEYGILQERLLLRLQNDELMLRILDCPFGRKYKTNHTLLTIMIALGAFHTTKRLLMMGWLVNHSYPSAQTYLPLQRYPDKQQARLEIVNILLRYGPEPMMWTPDGRTTPLHIAATSKCRPRCVEWQITDAAHGSTYSREGSYQARRVTPRVRGESWPSPAAQNCVV
ncbi:hypothetical protein QBC38DRAFT_447980 [Podospora fimiseda]|uniref:Uncharacterized protein n=1 Tax=Podospora fimiseda TaxID=252190 RepID=A0AAN7BGA9_9PEZI|nr:hypothetical protein QBC38DRAFT_447980 [Podospora fimiseda]